MVSSPSVTSSSLSEIELAANDLLNASESDKVRLADDLPSRSIKRVGVGGNALRSALALA